MKKNGLIIGVIIFIAIIGVIGFVIIRQQTPLAIDDEAKEIVAPKAILVGNLSSIFLPVEIRQGYVAVFDVYYKNELAGTAIWKRSEEDKTVARLIKNVNEVIKERQLTIIKHDADLRVQRVDYKYLEEDREMQEALAFNHEKNETIIGNFATIIQEPNAFEKVDLRTLEVNWGRSFPIVEIIPPHPGDPLTQMIVEVVKKTTVTVPVGTFDVWRIRTTISDSPEPTYNYITLNGRLVKISLPENTVLKLKSYSPIEEVMLPAERKAIAEEVKALEEEAQKEVVAPKKDFIGIITRDATREIDIRQIKLAQEMYWSENKKYYQSDVWPAEIPNHISMPKDPLNKLPHIYFWVNNTRDDQKFCVYATLEKGGWYAVSHRGSFECEDVEPTLNDCCFK